MEAIRRAYPLFSLCGLNCGLCPMYHISEESHCTGCGGEGRPSCAVLRCGREHGGIEYCFQCADYPCEKYRDLPAFDSFLPERNVLRDFERARRDGLEQYRAMLDEKVEILRFLLARYNDGRRKTFFCTAVNLLELGDIKAVMERLSAETDPDAPLTKEKAETAACLFRETADGRGIDLKLHKKPAKK